MYHRPAAEKIIRDTLENVYAGTQAVDVAVRSLRGHASYCHGEGDSDTAQLAAALAGSLEGGEAPTLTIQGQEPVTPPEEWGGDLPRHFFGAQDAATQEAAVGSPPVTAEDQAAAADSAEGDAGADAADAGEGAGDAAAEGGETPPA